VIRDYQLTAVVCILVLVDVLVLTVWEFVDPLVIVVSNKTLEILVSFPFVSSYRACNCKVIDRIYRLNEMM